MDPRRLILYWFVMTLFFAGLAAGAYTGLREVSAEADAVERRLAFVVLAESVVEDLSEVAGTPAPDRAGRAAALAPKLREGAERLRRDTAGGVKEAEGRNLAALVEGALASPADDVALREAIGAGRIEIGRAHV